MEENPQKHGFNFGFWGYVAAFLGMSYVTYMVSFDPARLTADSDPIGMVAFLLIAIGAILGLIGLFKKGSSRGWSLAVLLIAAVFVLISL